MYFVLYLFLYHSGTSIEVPEKKRKKKRKRQQAPCVMCQVSIGYLLTYLTYPYILTTLSLALVVL